MKRGNGFGSVIKLNGKRRNPYAVRVTHGWTEEGKQIYKYVGYYPTKREATKALEAYNSSPYDLMQQSLTTLEVYAKWEEQQKLSMSLFRTYKSTFKKCEAIYNVPFADLRLHHLEECMKLQTRTMQAAFKNFMMSMYRYAMKYDIVEKNVAEFLEHETFESKKKKVFTTEDVDRLWENHGNYPTSDVPLILLYTGLRINELLKLKTENVNLKEKYLITGSKTKAGKNRTIPIHDKILPLIEARLAACNEYLIVDENNKVIDDRTFRQKHWARAVGDILEETYTPHETRHTFVTYMNRLGIRRSIIQKIVGHAVSDITDVYVHDSMEELLEAINKLEY